MGLFQSGELMKAAICIAMGVVVAASGVLAFLTLGNPGDAPSVRPRDAQLSANGAVDEETTESPEAAADAKMLELKQPSERVEHLNWIARQEWARSDLLVLRKTIVSDPDEAVQLHAVEKALELALKEGAGATSGVVRTSLASTEGNTRARGLKAARENPDPKLVPTMLELVDNEDPYATMALNALAYTDSAEAHAKILQVAGDESAERKVRERAIALLAVTKDREAYSLLGQLANGEDEVLRKLADEVLKVLNDG
jgi:hypothetical protein